MSNLLTTDELRMLDAKEVKSYDEKLKGASFIGSTMEAYGDWNYYKLKDGSYCKTWFSIGD